MADHFSSSESNEEVCTIAELIKFLWSVLRQWKVLVTGAAFTLFIGIGEHFLQRSITVGQYLGILAALVFIASFLAWREQYREYEKVRRTPPEIELKIEDLVRHRTAGELDRWQYADIFIQASVYLRIPSSVQVEYALDLIIKGNTLRAELINDIHEWQVIEKSYFQHLRSARNYFYKAMPPLETSLSNTKKNDGWLHFRIGILSDVEVTESRMRLNAASSNGLTYIERDLVGTLAGPLVVLRRGRSWNAPLDAQPPSG